MMARPRSRYYYSAPSEDSLYYDVHSRPSSQFDCSENLSYIINVDPWSPCFTCVGWAPSQRRRCRKAIAQHNRSYASRLLEEGTIQLLCGEDVGYILEELAPRVLCRNLHQYQVNEMVCLWEQKVSAHLEDQRARLRATIRRLRRLRRAEYSQERDLQLPARGEPSRSAIVGLGLSSDPVYQTEASRTRRSVSVRQSSTSSFQRASQVSGIDHRPPSPTAPAEPVIESIESSQSGSTTTAVRRRIGLNDECSICQERFILNSTSSDRSQTLNGHDIAWCRARCGINFHSRCINEWKRVNVGVSQVNCPCWYVHFRVLLSTQLTRFPLLYFHRYTELLTMTFSHQPCFMVERGRLFGP